MVTVNPAKAARLDDRGEIAVGKRADLIAVSEPGGLPQITDVWRGGDRVYSIRDNHG
jgi:alpha-D-ribose 1-methylphosphonate 5-triphosphate diphosphatase